MFENRKQTKTVKSQLAELKYSTLFRPSLSFELRLLITPLVSSNLSYVYNVKCDLMC